MTRSVAPAQAVPEGVLTTVNVPVPTDGVVLGHDEMGGPVLVRLFGPQPTTAAFIGGWWAVQLLAHRCLAVGAVVVVDALDTDTPARAGTLASLDQWLTLNHLAGIPWQVRPALGGEVPGTAGRPVLHVHDVGPAGPAERPAPAGWTTHLTVLSRVTPASHPAFTDIDIVLTQRLDRREAALVGSAGPLRPELTAQVGVMDNETIAAWRGSVVRYIRLCPTSIERRMFG